MQIYCDMGPRDRLNSKGLNWKELKTYIMHLLGSWERCPKSELPHWKHWVSSGHPAVPNQLDKLQVSSTKKLFSTSVQFRFFSQTLQLPLILNRAIKFNRWSEGKNVLACHGRGNTIIMKGVMMVTILWHIYSKDCQLLCLNVGMQKYVTSQHAKYIYNIYIYYIEYSLLHRGCPSGMKVFLYVQGYFVGDLDGMFCQSGFLYTLAFG